MIWRQTIVQVPCGKFRTAQKGLVRCRFVRGFVPRAHCKTIIASIDAVSQRGAKLDWNRTFMLDREIGDTFACIDTIGRGKCLGRASLLTCIAATAAIPRSEEHTSELQSLMR